MKFQHGRLNVSPSAPSVGAMGEFVLPAGLKMQRLKAALISGTISELDFCVLFLLYSETDRRTGITELSHEEIADSLGKKKRTIERSTSRIIKAGHTGVIRHKVGMSAHGRNVFGGWGGKNRYNLMNNVLTEDTINSQIGSSGETSKVDRLTVATRSASETISTVAPGSSTLYIPESHKYPSDMKQSSSSKAAASIWEKHLTRQIGEDKFVAYFRGAIVEYVESGVCVLRVPYRYSKSHIDIHFSNYLLAAFQAQDASIVEVRVEHRAVPPSAGPI